MDANQLGRLRYELTAFLEDLTAEMGRADRRRWVEQSYQQMKEELGLDHFEGRSWRGWHHHVTLVLLAYAFLASARSAGKKGADGGRRSRRSGG